MKNQVLSIEQMKRLQKFGVDTSKAKMAWYAIDKNLPNCYNYLKVKHDVFDKIYPSVPTLTLQEMLEIMPRELYFFKKRFTLEIYPFLDSWYIRYYMPNAESGSVAYSFHGYKIIDAAYRCLRWLAKQGVLKGGEK